MARDVEVCDKCLRNCFLIHQGKHDLSPVVSSFFKVMFGKFSESLDLPPRFSRIFKSLVGKKTYLEDSAGQKWEVLLSTAKGSYAFQTGWSKFYLDHGIEQGDLLVFHYIGELHFIVKIYGRSTFEKTFRGEESYENKRHKSARNPITRNSPSDTYHKERPQPQKNDCFNAYDVPRSDTDIDPREDVVNNVKMSSRVGKNVQSQANINDIPQLVPEADLLVERCFMTDRGRPYAREDDRGHLFDLSAFESPDLKPTFSSKDDRENLFDVSTSKMTKRKVEAREDTREHLLGLSAFELPAIKPSFASKGGKLPFQGHTCSQESGALFKAQNGDTLTDTKKYRLVQGIAALPSRKIEANLSRSERSPLPSNSLRVDMALNSTRPLKSIRKSDTSEFSTATGYSHPLGETKRVVKQEPKEFKQGLFSGNLVADTSSVANLPSKKEAVSKCRDFVNLIPVDNEVETIETVKSEPLDFCESASAPFIRVTCSVPPDCESFLELPQPLPTRGRQKIRFKKKVIYLRDPSGKDWPVLYHYRYNLYVLASGWSIFRKANNIHPGNECAFVTANIDRGIYSVEVLNA